MKIAAWLRISSVTLCALALLACGASTTAPLSASALDAKKAGANKTTGSESAPSDSAAARRGSPDALVAFPTPIPVTEQDPSWGSPSAPVTIVEFTDLQCPFCGRGHATLKTIEEEYGPEKIRVILKHYPLPFHNKARPAAVVGAAIFQSFGRDAFWRYIDACFEKLGSQNLSEILADLNLDSERLRPIVESGESMTKVLSDMTLGERLGVNGTPAFFINGVALSGAQPAEAFKEIIDEQLAEAAALRKEGLEPQAISAKLTTKNFKKPEPPKPAPPPERDKTVHYVPVGKSPAKGPADAPITVVEFSDFECPYCARVQDTLAELDAKYPGKIRFVYKQLPLSFHEHATAAAQLSLEAYRKQGTKGFWRAKKKLFENSSTLEDSDLERIAKELNLNPAQTLRAIKDGKHKDTIRADQDLASDVGARGTPHFFVNGQRLVGAQPLEKFAEIIDEQLPAVQVHDGTVAAKGVYAHLMKDAKRPEPPARMPMGAPGAKMPSKGSRNAPITIQLFTDFECPFCARAAATLTKLEAHYGKRLRLVFRHHPLPFHQDAMGAHIAAHEVFLQKGDKAFWRYHDLLFESEALDTDTLVSHATKIGADGASVRAAIETAKHKQTIEQDMEIANKGGVDGTPAFVINKGWRISGAQSFRAFQRAIEHALKNP